MTLPDITDKEKEIIKEVLRFRFTDRLHLQKLLNHQDEKTIQFWLNDLVSKKYLVKDEEKMGKVNYPVYYIGPFGIRFLKTLGIADSDLLRNLYRERKCSPAFISHCLLITNISLTFSSLNVDSVTFTCFVYSDYSSPRSPFSFLKDLRPALVVEREESNNKRHMLFEIIPSTFPFYRMKKRIRTYLQFLQVGDWEINTATALPEIFFILPSKELKYRLKHFTKTLLQRVWTNNLSLNFTTENEVRQNGVNAEIWEEVEYM